MRARARSACGAKCIIGVRCPKNLPSRPVRMRMSPITIPSNSGGEIAKQEASENWWGRQVENGAMCPVLAVCTNRHLHVAQKCLTARLASKVCGAMPQSVAQTLPTSSIRRHKPSIVQTGYGVMGRHAGRQGEERCTRSRMAEWWGRGGGDGAANGHDQYPPPRHGTAAACRASRRRGYGNHRTSAPERERAPRRGRHPKVGVSTRLSRLLPVLQQSSATF